MVGCTNIYNNLKGPNYNFFKFLTFSGTHILLIDNSRSLQPPTGSCFVPMLFILPGVSDHFE